MKTIGSRIVICAMFGTVYYIADKTLTDVEATIDATVTSNLLVSRMHLNKSGLSGELIATGKTLGQALSGNNISITDNLSGTDDGTLKNY